MKHNLAENYSYSEIEHNINEKILNKRYRDILKSRLLDGYTFEEIGEMYDMTDRQIKNIVYKAEQKLFK